MARKSTRSRNSGGLLMYKLADGVLLLLLVHPGGPFFQKKDEGAWTVPKGEVQPGEDPLETAQREFLEETGLTAAGPFVQLTPVKQKGGKTVHAWAFAGDCDPATLVSNTFSMQWPPRSGKMQEFPEVDRAEFFDADTARTKINAAQIALIDELQQLLAAE